MNDVYFDVRRRAEALSRLGFFDHSKALTDAMAEGSTGTEILMTLRYRLRMAIEDGKIPSPEHVSLRSLYQQIDIILST